MRKARLFAPGASRTRPIAGMRSGRWATHFLKINHAPLIEHEQSPARRPDFSFVARPATRSRLLLWAAAAAERQSRTVADREATRLVIRGCGGHRARMLWVLAALSVPTRALGTSGSGATQSSSISRLQ